ncbi:hypothetical protein JMUB6875_39080 [Nocardia sp. JMUB6875]|uniref:hypothetical protein n=1 Tax=Nocardia sp. JMUB6875 TaxID=3158170 RepID=UPI0032E700FE
MPALFGSGCGGAFLGQLSGPPLGTVVMGDDGTILVTVRRQNWAVAWISAALILVIAVGLAVLITHAKFHEQQPIAPTPASTCQPFCSAAP